MKRRTRTTAIRLAVDTDRCVGCRICELACSYYNEKWFSPEDSRIRVTFDDTGGVEIEIPDRCTCEAADQPLCVELCPSDALVVSARADR